MKTLELIAVDDGATHCTTFRASKEARSRGIKFYLTETVISPEKANAVLTGFPQSSGALAGFIDAEMECAQAISGGMVETIRESGGSTCARTARAGDTRPPLGAGSF